MSPISPRLSALFDHVATHQESFIARVMDYVRHPSISAHDIGIREVADLLVKMLSDLGMEAEILPTAKHPMVYARRDVSPQKPTVLFYGHYDVQPPDPLELWTSPPFEPQIRDGRIYARGIGDNKGQHFAQLLAIETHLAVYGELPCNVIFLLEGEEEIGSPHLADFVRAHAARLKADLVITSDGALHQSGRPTINFGVRGIASFELRAKTAARDVHSGNFGGVVPNPIWSLVHLLATMKGPDGRILVEGIADQVTPASNAERDAMAALPLDLEAIKTELGLKRLDEPQSRDYYERLMFHPTLTINGFHGGYGGPGSKTVLPCEAVVKCDMRLVEPLTPDYVLEKLRVHVEAHAPEVDFVPLQGMLPSKTAVDGPWTAPLCRAILAARGVEPLLYPSAGGSLPDYVFTKILGLPAFVVPYANADEANHAPNENMEIIRFLDGIRTGCAMLEEIAA